MLKPPLPLAIKTSIGRTNQSADSGGAKAFPTEQAPQFVSRYDLPTNAAESPRRLPIAIKRVLTTHKHTSQLIAVQVKAYKLPKLGWDRACQRIFRHILVNKNGKMENGESMNSNSIQSRAFLRF